VDVAAGEAGGKSNRHRKDSGQWLAKRHAGEAESNETAKRALALFMLSVINKVKNTT
jgi:hypothetical protein